MKNFAQTTGLLIENNYVCLGILLITSFFILGFPLLFGLPSGYDMLTDIRFATVYRDGMLNGQFFPSWANDNFGFGSIGVRFYPPIAFYVLAAAELVTGNWSSALWVSLLFWMFLGCAGVYFFVKEFSTAQQGLIAGIAYAVVPQHLNEIFQFFLFAEFGAWGALPFCFWFLTRICRGGTWRDTVLFALAYSVLVLTHIPTTIIASFCFPIYVLSLTRWTSVRPTLLKLAVAIILVIAATSFRWVSIIFEYDWLSHNADKWSTGFYRYSDWFFPNVLQERVLFLYVLASWLFDIAILMTLALTIPAVIYLYKKRSERKEIFWRVLLASTITSWFAFFMLSHPSKFVWDNLPFLQKIQFPWRWLSVASLLAVSAFAFALPKLVAMVPSRARLFAYPALVLVVAIILFDITQVIIPSDPIPSAKFSEVERKLAAEPLFEGWWPVWAKEEAFEQDKQAFAGGRAVKVERLGPTTLVATVAAGAKADLRVPTFYYPHWKAKINGNAAQVKSNQNGVISIPLRGEVARVEINFEEPLANVFAGWLSLLTWLSLLGTSLWFGLREASWLLTLRPALKYQLGRMLKFGA